MFKSKKLMIPVLFASSLSVQAGWLDFIEETVNATTGSSSSDLAKSALSNSEVVTGLKDALANGVETAIKTLGKPGGFAQNQLVHIALPDSVKTLATTARAMGQGQYVDSFEATMNQAAEKAVPEAASILSDAIRTMSIDDAMKILNGPDDAATQYFRRVSGKTLETRFRPIVAEATNATGATQSYKQLTGQANPLLGNLLKGSSLDLDQYVTNKALDGLFYYIAQQEKEIRSNPAARTTEILQKVFSK